MTIEKSRRRSERVNASLKVMWVRRSGSVELTALDISRDGMFLRTDETTMPDSLMQLEIALPNCIVRLLAVARFLGTTARGRGIGAEIFAMDDRERRAWLVYYRSVLAAEKQQQAAAPRHAIAR